MRFSNNIKTIFLLLDRKGPEFDNSLFDLYGHGPLVEYYLYNNKGRKINKMVNRVNNVVTNIGNIVSLPKRNNKRFERRKKRYELRIRTKLYF